MLVALGFEVAMAHIESAEAFGLFGAAALGGGITCYLAGTALFARRLLGGGFSARFTPAAAFLALVSALAITTAGAVALMALFAVERAENVGELKAVR